MAGIAKLHEVVAEHGGEDLGPGEVVVGIETDRGSWVQALIASGYQVFAINLRQVNRFKERYASSGAKSDEDDAHALADMVRIDRAQLRPVVGDSEAAQAVKVVARAHQTLIWERTRTFQRLRSTMRKYFPAALNVYVDLNQGRTLLFHGHLKPVLLLDREPQYVKWEGTIWHSTRTDEQMKENGRENARRARRNRPSPATAAHRSFTLGNRVPPRRPAPQTFVIPADVDCRRGGPVAAGD
ncbi:IS110 family transposase [Streptomyces sp. cmx-4-7]|uniref:IS110 family transposase n=1 Tax=Streptomyces sp. cmx-4-7 TaxID=2790939 RepID=UPI00397EFBC9